jgi:hypothetical protein
MSDNYQEFTRGAIAIGNGDLMTAVNVKVSQKKAGTKIHHTIRKSNAGIFIGNEETTVTFDCLVPETGPERDFMRDLLRGKIRKLRIKIPGETFSVVGVYTGRDTELPSDDAVKMAIEFMGKTEA